MIIGIHATIYSDQVAALREFFRDQLDLEHVEVFQGWPLYATQTVEIGCHPASQLGAPPHGTHEFSFFCDDLRATMKELEARGVRFGEVEERLYGFSTRMQLPGGLDVELYEPRYRGPWSKPSPR